MTTIDDTSPTSSHAASDSRATINGYIRTFAQRVGADLDPLDSTGFSEFVCDQLTVGITANPEHDFLLMVVPMEGIKLELDGHVGRTLLALNFIETGPCSFAMDEEKRRLCLRVLRPLTGLSYQEFEQLLQAMAAIGRSMRARLNQLAEDPPEQ